MRFSSAPTWRKAISPSLSPPSTTTSRRDIISPTASSPAIRRNARPNSLRRKLRHKRDPCGPVPASCAESEVEIRGKRPQPQSGIAHPCLASDRSGQLEQPLAGHQDEVGGIGPFVLAGGSARRGEKAVAIVDDWESRVVFDRKIAVGRADEDATGDTAQFTDEERLVVPAADM